MFDESQLAALNYVKLAYATGTELGTLKDAIANDDDATWQNIVSLAARTTKRRNETYGFTVENIKNAARIANSWIMAAPADKGFVFAKVNNAEQKVSGVLILRNDGQVASMATKSLLAGSAADFVAGNDIPDSVAKFGEDKVWSLSVTDQSNLVFRKDGAPQFVLTPEGQASAAGVHGTLTVGESKPNSPLPELRTLWPPVPGQDSYGGWTLGISYAGFLTFSNNGEAKAVVTSEGRLWTASGSGFAASAAPVDITEDIAPEAALFMVVAGSILFLNSSFNLAKDGVMTAVNWIEGAGGSVADWSTGAADTVADWTTGAADDTAAWFTGATGTVTDGFDVAVDWSGTAIDDATDWVKDAGNTVYGGLKHLDPTSW